MSTNQAESTGARSTFVIYPIALAKANLKKTEIIVNKNFLKGIDGIERYDRLLILYYDGKIKTAVLKFLGKSGNCISVEYSKELCGKEIIDIKPYSPELDSHPV